MPEVSKEKILKGCIKGIKKSFHEYAKWNDGEWLWNAPEYLLTVNIAKTLWKSNKNTKYISLEDNVKKTLEIARASQTDDLNESARINGRSDIVFWSAKGRPKGIIEVKNTVFTKNKIQVDLDRIYELLNTESDLEFGITAFYINTNKKVNKASEKLKKIIKEEFIDKISQEASEASEASEDGYQTQSIVKKILSDKKDHEAAYAVAIMIYK